MKVFITGIAGFIGFHAALKLHQEGCDVVGIDNFNAYYNPDLKRARVVHLPKTVNVIEGDIAESDDFIPMVLAEQPDVVLHLAAQAGVRYSLENPLAYGRTNLVGHLNVLEACRALDGLSRLVYASSSSVYGGHDKTPFSENEPVKPPVSLYAATKQADELLSSTYSHLYDIEQIGLRFFTVYGPWGRPDMAYWLFSDAILNGRPIDVFNNGDLKRDFTHVDDIIDGIASVVLKKPNFEGFERPHRVYNIGNNQPETLMDFISILEAELGQEAQKNFKPMQPGDVYETYADIAAIAKDYGFQPKTSLVDGLKEFVDWFKAEGQKW